MGYITIRISKDIASTICSTFKPESNGKGSIVILVVLRNIEGLDCDKLICRIKLNSCLLLKIVRLQEGNGITVESQ